MATRSRTHQEGHQLELVRLVPKGDSTEPRFYWRCLHCTIVAIVTDYRPETDSPQPEAAAE